MLYVILGFCAQLIDGCLGMAYGVFLTTFLMANGVPLGRASSCIHFSEVFTTMASAVSHWQLKNVDWGIFKKLAIAGVIGGLLGAYVLSSLDGAKLKPFVSCYLILLGIRILWKAHKRLHFKKTPKRIVTLGVLGGFFDAIGGGGWGPIITSSLIAGGNVPSKVIGTVNSAEFFVTVAQSATFVTLVGIGDGKIILGLILGGMLAAPISAYVCKRVNQKILMILVGLLIVGINAYALYQF